MDKFDFATQTVECKYCLKRVSCGYSFNKHLQHCESEEGRTRHDPYQDHPSNWNSPLRDAIGHIEYAITQFGGHAPLKAFLDGRIGSFAEARTEGTIYGALTDVQNQMSLNAVLELISLAKCPLCHKTPCECYKEEDTDEDGED